MLTFDGGWQEEKERKNSQPTEGIIFIDST